MVKRLEELLSRAIDGKKKTISVAVAQDKVVLEAIIKAVEMNIINAILVGNEEEIKAIASEEAMDLSRVKIVNELDFRNSKFIKGSPQ